VNISARYIRLEVTGDTSTGNTQAREFEVYGTGAACTPTTTTQVNNMINSWKNNQADIAQLISMIAAWKKGC
jgi:hypothetical protein